MVIKIPMTISAAPMAVAHNVVQYRCVNSAYFGMSGGLHDECGIKADIAYLHVCIHSTSDVSWKLNLDIGDRSQAALSTPGPTW